VVLRLPRRERSQFDNSIPEMTERPNNSLQLTRLACGKLERGLPARLRENG
jgi:hypothetical protein